MSYTNTTGAEDRIIKEAQAAVDYDEFPHVDNLIEIIGRLDEQIEDVQKEAADREEGLQNSLDDSNQRVQELEREVADLEKTVDRLERELATADGQPR